MKNSRNPPTRSLQPKCSQNMSIWTHRNINRMEKTSMLLNYIRKVKGLRIKSRTFVVRS